MLLSQTYFTLYLCILMFASILFNRFERVAHEQGGGWGGGRGDGH